MYRIDEFRELMEELSIVRPKAFNKLIENDVRKWSRAYCSVQRYDLMTTNIAESMNLALRYARKLSITALMKSICAMLQKWFHNIRISTERTATPLTRRVSSIFQKNSVDSKIYITEPNVLNCKCTILSSSIKYYRSYRDVNSKQIL